MHITIRQLFINEAMRRINFILNMIIYTQRGNIYIHEYLLKIKEIGNYEVDLEIWFIYN